MAKEAEKSGQSTGKTGRANSTESKSGASANSGTAGEAGSKAKGETLQTRSNTKQDAEGENAEQKGDAQSNIREFQSRRHRELQQVLAKRSEESANLAAIVKEFAAVWLPMYLADAEVLASAFEEAGVDEDKMAAVRVRKDILNMLLADLLETGAVEHAKPKLEALADALEAVIGAASQELGSFAKPKAEDMSDLASQLERRFEEAKEDFEDIDESIREAMDLLEPRILSIASMRQQRRRAGPTSGRSGGERERASAGRGGDRERSLGRYEDEYESRRGRSMVRGGLRDEDGDEDYRSRRSVSPARSEEERYGGRGENRGRGQRGWFGLPEGRAEAARREWEEDGYRPQRRDEDEGYGRSRSRYAEDEDRRYNERRPVGYGGGYESQQRGEARGGGSGDYESKRGGRRYADEDEDARYWSRGRGRFLDEDDERGSHGRSGGGGHAGWAGDAEGHSEAARRGWERRRSER